MWDFQNQQNGQEQPEQHYGDAQEQQYIEGQEQEGDDQSYPSLEPAALEMVMERAEGDDELAEHLRTALTIIDDCMNDYGLVPAGKGGERYQLSISIVIGRSTSRSRTMEERTVSERVTRSGVPVPDCWFAALH